MTYDQIIAAAQGVHLVPLGGVDDGGQTIILLGPREPGFWDYASTHPEFIGKDPLDRWSVWAITGIARALGADPLFPFGGPPFQPFITWALQSGEVWKSPVGLLVHGDAGLLVSYRGALRFDRRIDLPKPGARPCDSCDKKPCLAACPVSALGVDGYDVPSCKAHILTDPVCASGCRVRLSCPVSQSYARDPEQTAFHMKAFARE